jgi:hypothetical protein
LAIDVVEDTTPPTEPPRLHCAAIDPDPFTTLTDQPEGWGGASPGLVVDSSCRAMLREPGVRETMLDPATCGRLKELVGCRTVVDASQKCVSTDVWEWTTITFASGRVVQGNLECSSHSATLDGELQKLLSKVRESFHRE